MFKTLALCLFVSGCTYYDGSGFQQNATLGDGGADAGAPGSAAIWFVGDSITAGSLLYGAGFNVDYGGFRTEFYRLAQAEGYYYTTTGSMMNGPTSTNDMGATVLPRQWAWHDGHSGFETRQMLLETGIPTWASTPGLWFNTAVILAGTNDVNRAMNPDVAGMPGTVRDSAYQIDRAPERVINLAKLSREYCHFTCRVVVATIPPIRQKEASVVVFNTKLRALVTAEAADWLSLADVAAKMTLADISDDGLHPAATGYSLMGGVIYDAVRGR